MRTLVKFLRAFAPLAALTLAIPAQAPADLLFRPGQPYVNYAYESCRA